MGAEIQVLVVGEDTDCFVQKVLEAEGWAVTTASSTEALGCVQREQPDAVVLHLERYGRGLEICMTLRKHSRVPLMVLSRSTSEDDIVAGLRCGADALVLEGVGSREFVARLRALLRRVPRRVRHEPVDVIVVGPIELNRATRQVTVDGRALQLPRREFDILEMLMHHADLIVTRASLRRQLWGVSRDSRTLDVQVRRLRARLAAAEGARRIVTVRGVGYRFSSELLPTLITNGDVEVDLTQPRHVDTADGAPHHTGTTIGATTER